MCCQRFSNNSEPKFTDIQATVIYLYGINLGFQTKLSVYNFAKEHLKKYCEHMPTYKQFCLRINKLTAGTVAETSRGSEHYKLDETDQINILSNADMAKQGYDTLYHSTTEDDCRVYSPDEMLAVAAAAIQFKTYHLTYYRLLKQWVKREDNAEILRSISYGVDLPEDLAIKLEQLLGAVTQ